MAQSRAGSECDMIQKDIDVEYHVTSLGAFLHCARYGPTERLPYPQMVSSCSGGDVLLYVSLCLIRL